MSTEPPSLAARLEQTGPLSWREAARLTARLARVLDRLHAQSPAHGGIEPLTVLFVGGTVRLADPLPEAGRNAAFVDPRLVEGGAPDRQSDFYSLGRVMAAMVGAVPDAAATDRLPPPLAAVQQRLVGAEPMAGYRSGNEIAAALELGMAASEGFAEPPAPPEPPPPQPVPGAPLSEPPSFADMASPDRPPVVAAPAMPASPPVPSRPHRKPLGRGRPRLVFALAALLLIGGVAVLWLRPEGEVAVEQPVVASDPPRMPQPAVVAETEDTATDDPAAAAPETVGELPLEEVLAALPDLPTTAAAAPPPPSTAVRALLAELTTRPCTRLEVEPTSLGLRLVGSTADTTTRTELLARIAELPDIDKVTLSLDETGAFCRLYDMLAAHTEPRVPRLVDHFPTRPDDRLTAGEPLVLKVLTPPAPRHLAVDYFTADGMVVHLATPQPEAAALPPAEEVWIGDPADGERLTISAPFGPELVLVIASEAPVFSTARPMIEPAPAYLDALEAALAAQPAKPEASTIAIRTVPAPP